MNLDEPFLSVIVPAYNEAARIESTLYSIVGYLKKQSFSSEVLIVNDGSTDQTFDIAKQFIDQDYLSIRILTISHGGKGRAVRTGILSAKGKYRFMADADLSMPIEQLDRFIIEMESGREVVIGSRQIVGARRFGEPSGRHIAGRCFNLVVSLLVIRGFDDTQCGFKCFSGDVAESLFSLSKLNGFGFDVEILYLANKKGFNIVEIPIDWYHQPFSKVRLFRDSALMFLEIIKIVGFNLFRKYSL